MTELDQIFLMGFGIGILMTLVFLWATLRKYLSVSFTLWRADRKSIPLFIMLTADKYIFFKLPERIRSGFAEVAFAGQRYLFNLKKGTRFILKGVPTYLVTDMSIPALSFEEILSSERYMDEYFWETVLRDHVNKVAEKCGLENIVIDTPREMLELMATNDDFRRALMNTQIAYQNSPYSIDYLTVKHHRQKPAEVFSIMEQYATELQLRVIGLKKLEALKGVNWKAILMILAISIILLMIFMVVAPMFSPAPSPTPPVGQGVGG